MNRNSQFLNDLGINSAFNRAQSNNGFSSGFSTNGIFTNRIQNNGIPVNRQSILESDQFLKNSIINNALNNRIGSTLNSRNPVLTALRNSNDAFIGSQPTLNSVNSARPSNAFDLLSMANNLQNNKNDGLTTLGSEFLYF